MKRLLILCAAGALLISGLLYARRTGQVNQAMAVVGHWSGGPAVGGAPPMPEVQVLPEIPGVRVEEVARNLDIVWGIAFSGDGRMFFTERPGRIRVLRPGRSSPEVYADLTDVADEGEGGLMGLALHPEFPRQPWIYVMYTTRAGGRSINRVSRIRDRAGTAEAPQTLVDDIPAAMNHDGGAVAFGPDGMLYAGTGDAANPPLAQEKDGLAGKILRLTPDGKPAPGNPFPGSPVYAYGFRNVTGLAWHPVTGDLWAASHGPSGEFTGLFGRDTVYIVKKGGNHGWPLVSGATTQPGIESPVLLFIDPAVPPGGLHLLLRGAVSTVQEQLLPGDAALRRPAAGGRRPGRKADREDRAVVAGEVRPPPRPGPGARWQHLPWHEQPGRPRPHPPG